MFDLSDTAGNLVGRNVNIHSNIFLMVDGLHHLNDHLKFWLEEEVIGEPNTYDVCAADPTFFTGVILPPRRRVTFKVDPEVEAVCRVKNNPIPALPSPSLLAIRAAFSRVAYLNRLTKFFATLRRHL
ncbi:hypothetical protein B0H13DRAFT_1894818 [Mycena leptocephala]|nr:hypothetical protein B0H13DRAFT_1894818 [Mycena leptocephala]